MVYFVYKDSLEKLKAEMDLNAIHEYIYHKELTDAVKENMDFIPFDSITDEKGIEVLNKDFTDCYDDGVDIYVKCYGLNVKRDDRKKKMMIDYVTYTNSGNDSVPYLRVFFDALDRKVYYAFLRKKGDFSILDDIGDLGLLAFSSSPYITENNNILFHSYLYDRGEIKRKYDSVMGEGEFDKLFKACEELGFDYALNNKNVADYQFFTIMEALKSYFHKSMKDYYVTHDRDTFFEEKNAMVVKFNDAYAKLIERQREHQNNRFGTNKKVDF